MNPLLKIQRSMITSLTADRFFLLTNEELFPPIVRWDFTPGIGIPFQ